LNVPTHGARVNHALSVPQSERRDDADAWQPRRLLGAELQRCLAIGLKIMRVFELVGLSEHWRGPPPYHSLTDSDFDASRAFFRSKGWL